MNHSPLSNEHVEHPRPALAKPRNSSTPDLCPIGAVKRRSASALIVSMTWFTTACVVIEDGEVGVTKSFGPEMLRSKFIHGIKRMPCAFTPGGAQ